MIAELNKRSVDENPVVSKGLKVRVIAMSHGVKQVDERGDVGSMTTYR